MTRRFLFVVVVLAMSAMVVWPGGGRDFRLRSELRRTAIALAEAVSPAVTLAAQATIDITGEWVFDVQTEAGGGSPSFVFTQTGEKLTGKYKGAFGEAELTGTVTGKTMKFSFSADAQGTPLTVVYEGEIESNSSIKGKVDLGGLGSGTFAGKRTK